MRAQGLAALAGDRDPLSPPVVLVEALTPQVAHLPASLGALGPAVALAVFTPASLLAFRRRAIT
ncbi:hypothetical protein [Amycolatopsis sp. WAC 01416]|uniref:hypothetical protein n=1 Tax=Amycolatopsis sp. WAC 01416 TaxID=2203196 RepID=UPI0018F79BBD|nr:hypothetical protein [Amycolatopsis sp. WAC 01416]